MSCISCKKCKFIRNQAFCGTVRLTEKQLYNNRGYCSEFEEKIGKQEKYERNKRTF